jgi:hypothetical protein
VRDWLALLLLAFALSVVCTLASLVFAILVARAM